MSWWRKAADQGNPFAQLNLGAEYYKGVVVGRDYEEAARWFTKAAAQGNADAQARLEAMREMKLIPERGTL